MADPEKLSPVNVVMNYMGGASVKRGELYEAVDRLSLNGSNLCATLGEIHPRRTLQLEKEFNIGFAASRDSREKVFNEAVSLPENLRS